MHYIRLLRAPKLTYQGDKKYPWTLNVVLTVTTDLGDSFLVDDEPVKLKVTAGWEQRTVDKNQEPMKVAAEKVLRWSPGMRVLKADIPAQHLAGQSFVPNTASGPMRVLIRAAGSKTGELAADIALAGAGGSCGKIMPLWADVHTPASADVPTTCVRRILRSQDMSEPYIEIEEDIGESIARHIWDAGLVAVSRLWLLNGKHSNSTDEHPISMSNFHALLFDRGPINILELGCGVGILGIGLAQMMAREKGTLEEPGTILMTDLPEAEERASANIDRLARVGTAPIRPEYENLDWDDGREGNFGPLVKSRFWHLVILSDCTYNVDALPALVDTWTAIHKQNLSKSPDGKARTRVAVAMKKRHSDEERLWQLVGEEGWSLDEESVTELPVLGEENQRIFLYLFESQRTDFENRLTQS
ncbi:UPF0665 family protein C23C4.06c [Colletotrichum chlorophyti]|uniref:UPF0665 family protein C23C4.06c n=1 Tax=Colletotrichum chlorophyti TaxID=708187 RepID=A0A1Q8S9B6_9PEZI|nr:UPF0665 family protein C23C4.06c [Colletotrichum chlorophyti]